MITFYFQKQTIATFFSHIMSSIGGNSAGPGRFDSSILNFRVQNAFRMSILKM